VRDNRKTTNGQLRKLEDRMSKYQMEKRATKIVAREQVAVQLARENAITRGMLISVLGRGFFGRLKWLLFGR